MSEYVRVIEEEEEGIGIMKALAILSSNEHRNTSQWRLVEEQHFKNGRLDETHIYVVNYYDRPDEHFEATKFLKQKQWQKHISWRVLRANLQTFVTKTTTTNFLLRKPQT